MSKLLSNALGGPVGLDGHFVTTLTNNSAKTFGSEWFSAPEEQRLLSSSAFSQAFNAQVTEHVRSLVSEAASVVKKKRQTGFRKVTKLVDGVDRAGDIKTNSIRVYPSLVARHMAKILMSFCRGAYNYYVQV